MCIAIYKKAGTQLLPETLQTSWNSNPDGAGFMYAEKNKLNIVKGLMTFTEFLDAYEPHKEKECVLHFRIRTHGEANAENTHPFLISKTLGLVHNGIISKLDLTKDTTKSDTWHFTQQHLTKFYQDNPKFFLNSSYKQIIEEFIGWSKLIFMDNKGNIEIYNEKAGSWNSGCWFSNSSWETKHYTPPKPRKTQIYQPRPKSNVLQMGDTCQTRFPIGWGEAAIPAKSYVNIKFFGMGISVHVEEILTGIKGLTTLENLASINDCQTTKFEIGKVYKFNKNYNHFRIGEKVTCLSKKEVNSEVLMQKQWTFDGGTSEKTYWIPSTLLDLDNTLLPETIPQRDFHQDSMLNSDSYSLWD